MKNIGWFFRLLNQQPALAGFRHIAGATGAAILAAATCIAAAQSPAQVAPAAAPAQTVVPDGYAIHQTADLGGHISSVSGSDAMYSTLVNIQSGPRVLGETFEMHALPGKKHTLVDSLSAVSNGFGGDPNNFSRLDISKGRIYDFSGLFRRDRQYFDYDLLGNPNIPPGLTVPIGPAGAPTGSLAWPQVNQSPVLFNTVRRMTDTSLTLYPISKVTFRAAYSQNIFQGPSLSPDAGSNFYDASVGANDALLEQFQRNSTDDFTGAIDWKPLRETRLTFEEQVDHFKADSYFTLNPAGFLAQEADGTPAYLGNWDSTAAPYGLSNCNKSSMINPTTVLYPNPSGGRPIIDPACDVAISYLRSQPTRILYPTEIFRFQSSSIRSISTNGDFRYTSANMNLPNYYEVFQGLDGAVRSTTFTGNASAKREVVSADYGLVWQAMKNFSLSEQIDYSNVHQPGTANISAGATAVIPAAAVAAGMDTVNYTGPLTAGKPVSVDGSPNGVPAPDYFGQKFLTNNLTGTWDASSRATLSLTWRYRTHKIAEGIPDNIPLPVGADTGGTVTINENGGIFGAALRPSKDWSLNGSFEMLYADNAFTPVGPRQSKHYRVHTMYRLRPWATLSGAFNDQERHNNTNNNQAAVAAGDVVYAGPIGHVDHSRIVSVGGVLSPNEHYGFDFDYAYSDVYASTNICYDAAATPALPGAASPSGTACPGASVRGDSYYEFGPVKDFMDAPTQFGSAALTLSPVKTIHSNLGYRLSKVTGNQFFNNAQAVNGSLHSNYQSPFASVAWTVHSGWIWKAEYNYFGYGEGGPSGAPYCSASNPTPTAPAPVVPCNSSSLAGPTGLTESSAGLSAPRNFHANNVTLGMHYEF